MAYLNELHPELFAAAPRSGGVAKIVPSKPEKEEPATPEKGAKITNKSAVKSPIFGKASVKSVGGMSKRSSIKSTTGSAFEAAFLTSTPENNSREYRINKVLHTSQWMPPDYDDDPNIPMPSSDPLSNVMMILSIAISTIMLMPTEFNYIPKDHLKWTLSYLECIKDEFGSYPPNVRGIMNQIKLIDSTIESFNETQPNGAGADIAAERVLLVPILDPVPAAPAPDAAAAPAPDAAAVPAPDAAAVPAPDAAAAPAPDADAAAAPAPDADAAVAPAPDAVAAPAPDADAAAAPAPEADAAPAPEAAAAPAPDEAAAPAPDAAAAPGPDAAEPADPNPNDVPADNA